MIFGIAIILISWENSFAETKPITVADNSYERIYIPMKQGDEINYSITVEGGRNDDVEFTIYYPDGTNDGGGRVYQTFDDRLVAHLDGRYVFEFDNTFSLLSNKQVEFSYEITKNTYYVYVSELPSYAKDYAGNAVYDATEYWKKIFPKKQFFVADSPENADIMIQWVKDFTGMKHVGFQYQELIEVGLGDSNCWDQ